MSFGSKRKRRKDDVIDDDISPRPIVKEVDELEQLEFLENNQLRQESEEVWLISYADLMTLLVGFFALLLSFSKVDSPKFEKVKVEATRVFGGQYTIPYSDLSGGLEKVIKNKGLSQLVNIDQDESGVSITFQGALFFDSAGIDLKTQAVELLNQVIPIIRENAKGFHILIEGHTDDQPIYMKSIKSNWALSGIRAATVALMFEEKGVPKNNLEIVGWGETRPLAPNLDKNNIPIPENRSQNRRVVIRVLRDGNSVKNSKPKNSKPKKHTQPNQ